MIGELAKIDGLNLSQKFDFTMFFIFITVFVIRSGGIFFRHNFVLCYLNKLGGDWILCKYCHAEYVYSLNYIIYQ